MSAPAADPAADPATGGVPPEGPVASAIRAAASRCAACTRYLDLGARLDRAGAVAVGSDAVAWATRHPRSGRQWIIGMGDDPGEVARCVTELAEEVGLPYGLTVERRAFAQMPRWLRPVEHWEWDWWYATQPPALRDGEACVTPLASHDARINLLLDDASPDAMARPGDRHITGWWGIEAEPHADLPGTGGLGSGPPDARLPGPGAPRGAPGTGTPGFPATVPLVAVAAVTEMRPGVPHLSSVATRGDRRGRGLARDLCARLTRDALAGGAPAVTLGMHAGNAVARRVYDSLGFDVGYRWASGTLPADRT